jgi:hypothetical protein
MSVERFVIPDVVKLDDNGKTAEFTYSDIFDPDKFKDIVSNPNVPFAKRDRCAHRLLQAKVITLEELNELLPKPS